MKSYQNVFVHYYNVKMCLWLLIVYTLAAISLDLKLPIQPVYAL